MGGSSAGAPLLLVSAPAVAALAQDLRANPSSPSRSHGPLLLLIYMVHAGARGEQDQAHGQARPTVAGSTVSGRILCSYALPQQDV